MRISHVITRLVVGGAQENTVASVLGLQQLPGWDVKLLSGPTRGPEGSIESLARQNLPQSLIIVPTLVRPVHPWLDLKAFKFLCSHFRENRPHIVHTHSGKAGILGRIAAKRARVPVIIHTIHGPSFGAFQGTLPNLLFRSAERWAARCTDHFVVVAQAMAHSYLQAGIGSPNQFTRIFSGFDIQPFLKSQNNPALRQSLQLTPNDFVVGKIARLFPLKGHEDLLAIAPRLVKEQPNIRFLLVGDGIWRPRFEQMALEAGLKDHFVFAGLVPPQEVARYIGIMDTVVHLSRREGLPRALPQALAAGKPVVAFDCDGAGEVCRNNRTGFLVMPGDRDRLFSCILELARSPELRRRLGETGREQVREWFPVERMIEDLKALYLQLAQAGGLA